MNEMRGGRGPNRGLLLLIPAALILAKAAKHRRQAMWESAEGRSRSDRRPDTVITGGSRVADGPLEAMDSGFRRGSSRRSTPGMIEPIRNRVVDRRSADRSDAIGDNRPVTHGWVEIGDRVFVRRYAFFDQNIGVVLADGEVLVIDTRSTHVQAREILTDLRELTADPVTVVVDTHGHFDHAYGNHVFRPATIWGHERCVTFMDRHGESRRARIARNEPAIAADLRRGRHRPAGPDVRRDGVPRSRRPARRAALPRARPHRPRRRHRRARDAASCSPATCSRTAPSPGSATAIRSTGRRPPIASRSWRQAVVVPGHGDHAGPGFADAQATRDRGAGRAGPARPCRRDDARRGRRRRRRSPSIRPRTSGGRSSAPSSSCAASSTERRALGLLPDPDDPATARRPGDDPVERRLERVQRDLASRARRGRAAAGRWPADPTAPRRRAIGIVHRIHPEQRDAAQDEREDRRRRASAPPALPRGRDRRPGPQRSQHVRQRRRTDRVDRPGPSFRFERPALAGHLVPCQDPGRAHRPAAGRPRRSCRSRPRPRSRGRPGSPAPCRRPRRDAPVTSTGPSSGSSPRSSSATTDIAAVKPAVPIAIASRGDRPGRQRHDPAGRHALVLGVAAVARRRPGRSRGRAPPCRPGCAGSALATTSPGEVDPRDERADPGDLAVRPRRQPVLVVDARPGDPDLDLAGRQVGLVELAHAALDAGRIRTGDLLGDEGAERGGDGGHARLLGRWLGAIVGPARGCVSATVVDVSTILGDHARTVTHTQVSWNMCMRWRPRRAEDGV